ncbi:MAG: antibiotic biosynthesis monooxygenase family protein [Myxococcota bacterium]|nr:antibiotic biosynthesis monooxygenase family protein [Myxococcota bacterium]
MSCAVVAEFVFQEGKIAEGLALLESPAGLEATRDYKGCNQVDLALDTENPNKVVLTEFWDSKDDHLAYFQWRQEGDESGALEKLGAIMAAEPKFTWANIKKTY